MSEQEKQYFQEYALKNKDKLRNYKKQYRLQNKEKIRLEQLKWRIENKERKNAMDRLYASTHKEEIKQYRKNNLLKIKAKYLDYCSIPEVQKRIKEYNVNYRAKNRDKKLKHYLENKNKILITTKKYYLKNKEKLLEYGKQYRLLNKEKHNVWRKQKLKADAFFRLNYALGGYLRSNLKKNNISKTNKSWKNLLMYSSDDVKVHLEKQFDSKMSWDNYGSFWHIDHVVPLSWFKTEEQLIKHGWALKNLQPLESTLNKQKSDSFVGNPKTNLGVICL